MFFFLGSLVTSSGFENSQYLFWRLDFLEGRNRQTYYCQDFHIILQRCPHQISKVSMLYHKSNFFLTYTLRSLRQEELSSNKRSLVYQIASNCIGTVISKLDDNMYKCQFMCYSIDVYLCPRMFILYYHVAIVTNTMYNIVLDKFFTMAIRYFSTRTMSIQRVFYPNGNTTAAGSFSCCFRIPYTRGKEGVNLKESVQEIIVLIFQWKLCILYSLFLL